MTFKSEGQDKKVALFSIFFKLSINGFMHREQLRSVYLGYLDLFLVFYIFQFFPFLIIGTWTRLLLFLYASLIHEYMYCSMTLHNFDNTHDAVLWIGDEQNEIISHFINSLIVANRFLFENSSGFATSGFWHHSTKPAINI